MDSNHMNHHFREENLIIIMVLNFIITLVEVIGGLLSGSLSLLSDALHNFSDGISIMVSFIALRLSKRENTLKNTFGYKRAEILAALFNSSFLIIIAFFLFKEAYLRIQNPQNIESKIMITVAFVGLVANTVSVFLLKSGSKDNINIRSAYVHLFSDSLSSLGVIIGGILIYCFNITIIDPILTFIIGVYVLKEGFDILKQSINILMEKTPVQINILKIKEVVEKIPEVDNLHHVHIWQANDKEFLFEGHIDVRQDINLSKAEELRSNINSILFNEFGINHTTLQIEYNCCKDKEIIKNR
ncbi:MAG: cation transporter [Candidatus Infernicultor aquiphilus]|uniref:Cation transporter n=2 Tax=Candidatus Infernicultor aquiphilus TaxID=1805029 RepID=A0A1J5GGB0_9BACT|nr:cation transporter [bacterium]OIP71777.1 MAG: cation transporter [Candidatus Atribacteria bacterium CG2_30_33_13]PIU24731.1 MAG: cation transporter [Candidatus Atribacteria bacterium CG08_land_8_20_14_0_20_33_29]PIW12609.1 MAG: cation transporter [Candidatus Atribacteria bacterium CG17_big_fil_post_rev_8_21_14_2_50_34_11]PIX33952.1 MAG: cation transporter [Candidatus Atribacteria bacterium CG_4_8_14_3_um_filter_34_18]PIY31336.1 MAG: cation transporter [Candidatus Atribacteria bacterium CG_4